MTVIHPERAMRVAQLTDQILEVESDIKVQTKPMKALVKQLKKKIKKILETPTEPANPEDEQVE